MGAADIASRPTTGEDAAYRVLRPGDRLPPLVQASGQLTQFGFRNIAGRYQLYAFFLSLELANSREVLDAVQARRDVFDDLHCAFIGVTVRPEDRSVHGLKDLIPGIRFAWDFDHAMSEACGATPIGAIPGEPMSVQRCWVLVDPSLHVIEVAPMHETSAQEMIDKVAALPPPDDYGGVLRPAPILLLPNVFDPALCSGLIAAYHAGGGEASGVHRGDRGVLDPGFKRRKDCDITDPELLATAHRSISRRVLPEIKRLFYMDACYIERNIVGCYSAEDGGHFAAHTDNGGGATVHRRFALSVNLNDDFEGGQVVFPEYNMAGYKAPAGWAIVFPCGALHAVRPVTQGARYAFLPFLYDDGGLQLYEAERAKPAAS
jgi:predicted 2-oxoglutarate/Fe(II)-dependent dioxygenase YbiX